MSRISMIGFQYSKRDLRFCLFVGLLLTFTTSAARAEAPRNTLSLRYHVGQAAEHSTDPSLEGAGGYTAHFATTYLYNISPSLSLGAGYIGGDGDNYEPIFDSGSIHYRAFAVIAEGRIVLSERHRNFLYGRLSGLKFDYDIFDGRDGPKEASDNGTDISAAVGWSVRSGGGVGFEFGYEYLRLDSDIDLQTVSFGMTFSF